MIKQQIGFTLIELLVVILIISIVSGIAVISTKPNIHQQIQMTSQAFTNQLQLAEQEALLRSAVLGLKINATGWQFQLFSSTKQNTSDTEPTNLWQPIFKAYHLPRNLQIILKNKENYPTDTPQIIISPSGELTPFTLWLGQQNAPPAETITGKDNGEIRTKTITTQ